MSESPAPWKPGFRLRDAGAGDLPGIRSIYAHHVVTGTGTFEEQPPDLPVIARRWRSVVEAGLPYLVAVGDDRILGYAYAARYHARSAYRFALEDSVYVAPEAMGNGLGTALVSELLSRTEAAGFRQMVSVIGDSANLGSIRLHESLGFEHVGTLRSIGFKFGRWLDVVMMQRPLGPGGTRPASPAAG
jgi:L-amino acid N-acyltransferase YncA